MCSAPLRAAKKSLLEFQLYSMRHLVQLDSSVPTTEQNLCLKKNQIMPLACVTCFLPDECDNANNMFSHNIQCFPILFVILPA
jgi:hypothetical protein